MGLGQIPGWPFITFGWGFGTENDSASSYSGSEVTGASPWVKPNNPVSWYGMNRVWGTRQHSSGSIGYDKTYEVNYIAGWKLGPGNNVFLSTATKEEDI